MHTPATLRYKAVVIDAVPDTTDAHGYKYVLHFDGSDLQGHQDADEPYSLSGEVRTGQS